MKRWELAARARLRDLVERNFHHYDHDEMVDAYAVFTQDAVIEFPPGQRTRRGRDDILERFGHRPDGRLGPYGYVRHNLTNHLVTRLTRSEASAVSYYLVHSDGRIVTGGVFYDDFVRRDGRWWIRHRRIHQDFLTVPGAQDAPSPATAPDRTPR